MKESIDFQGLGATRSYKAVPRGVRQGKGRGGREAPRERAEIHCGILLKTASSSCESTFARTRPVSHAEQGKEQFQISAREP